MKWKVQVTGVPADLRMTRDLLVLQGFALIDDENGQFLVGGLIDSAVSAQDAWKVASAIAFAVNSAGEHHADLPKGLVVGGEVHELQKNGSVGVHRVITVVSAHGIATGSSTAIAISTEMSLEEAAAAEAQSRERAYEAALRVGQRRVASARDPQALKVQRLLDRKLIPQTMGVISDIMMRGRKEGYRYRYAPKGLWSRFDKSIGAPEVMGDDARHGGLNPKPFEHVDPMTLAEADAFLREAAERYLADVAGHPIPHFDP